MHVKDTIAAVDFEVGKRVSGEATRNKSVVVVHTGQDATHLATTLAKVSGIVRAVSTLKGEEAVVIQDFSGIFLGVSISK